MGYPYHDGRMMRKGSFEDKEEIQFRDIERVC